MPSRLNVALAAALGLAFVVTPAFPQPSPTTSDVPAGIILVGARDGVPDPHGEFEIVVRDAASNPIPFTNVRIDFSQCLDVWPSAVQPYPGVSMSCGTRIVTATTDADGRARMILMGSVLYRTPSSGWQCAQVRADPGNVVIGSVNAACADQDGIDGVDNRDVNRVLCDQQDADFEGRSDFNTTHSNDFADFGVISGINIGQQSIESGPRCDGLPHTAPTMVDPAATLNLAWNECRGGGGTSLETDACNSNTGQFGVAIGSVVPSMGIPSAIGFDAVVDIVGEPGAPLPDWWRFDPDGCRSTSLGAGVASSGACVSPLGSASLNVTYPFGAPNVERIVVRARYDAPEAIAAGTELALFQLSINRQRTVQGLIGPPPCAGCSSPVLIKFRSVKILGGAGWSCETPVQGQSLASGHLSVFADRPGSTSHVFAQGEITGVGDPVTDAMGLWLEGAHPSRRALEIGFSLSSDAPARVEVVDAAGRRVEARDVDGTTGGRQRMTLGSAALLRPGVYWVRLTQGTEHRSIKAVCIP